MTCRAKDAPGAHDVPPRNSSVEASSAPPDTSSNTPNDWTPNPLPPSLHHPQSELIQSQLQTSRALLQAATAMAVLAQAIQNLIEYGTEHNEEESDYPSVGLDGKPIPRA